MFKIKLNSITNHLLSKMKRFYKKYIVLITILLFIISMTIFPVTAQVDKSDNSQGNALEIVKQAQNLYQQGQFTAAIDKWKQADYIYTVQNDRLNRSMVLSNLALTYQKIGNWQQSTQYIEESLNTINTLEKTIEQQRILAQSLDIQGQEQFVRGQIESALDTWNKSANIYIKIGEKQRLFSNQINQSQAMQKLGLYPRSCEILLKAFQIDGQECNITNEQLGNIEKQILAEKDNQTQFTQIKGLHSLGNTIRGLGNLKKSEEVLLRVEKVLLRVQEITKNIFPEYQSNVLISLGNTARSLCEAKSSCEKAQIYYQQAINQTSVKEIKLEAILNHIDLSQDISKIAEAEKIIVDLPNTQARLYGEIKLTEYQFCQKEKDCLQQSEQPGLVNKWDQNLVVNVVEKLKKIAKNAAEIGDKRTKSYSLIMVGRVYEKMGLWEKAREYTQQALEISQQLKAFDISYQTQWQLGRLLLNLHQNKQAIIAYDNAVNDLKNIRSDLISLNPDVQYDFKERVEPVYRQYVNLLLQDRPTQNDLRKARDVIESLQLAELQNFFILVGYSINIFYVVKGIF